MSDNTLLSTITTTPCPTSSAVVPRSATVLERLDAATGAVTIERSDVDRVFVVRQRHEGRSLILVPLSMTEAHKAAARDLVELDELAAFDGALAAGTIW